MSEEQEFREERKVYEVMVGDRLNAPRFAVGNKLFIPGAGQTVIDEIILDEDNYLNNGFPRYMIILKIESSGERVFWRSYPADLISVTYDIRHQISQLSQGE